MKRLLILMGVLAAALWLGLGLRHHPGMLILTVANWRIDMPLWLAVLALIISYLLLYCVYKVFAWLMDFAGSFKRLLSKRRQRQAKQLTQKGFLSLAEGHWLQAERSLTQGASYSEMPWLNFLSAAKAAQELDATERRDIYLRKAHEMLPNQTVAVNLTQAQLQYQQGQYEQSLATLQQLSQKEPNHPYVLKLYHDIYWHLQSWEKLLAILPKLKQQHVFSSRELLQLEKKIYLELLTAYLQNQSWESLQLLWRKMPLSLHQEKEIALLYAKALHLHHKPVEAEAVLRKALKYHWSEDLIILYGQLSYPQENKILAHAESWLQDHPESPGLLFALGNICMHQQLWGKAQRYFEASLSLAPTAHAYAALGALLEKMDQPELGAQYFKKGLLLATPNMV